MLNKQKTSFTCGATIAVTDAATNAVIPGWTAEWTYTIDADRDGVTDTLPSFPLSGTSAGTVATSSSIPTVSALKASKKMAVRTFLASYPTGYPGTACMLTVSVSATGYETTQAAGASPRL